MPFFQKAGDGMTVWVPVYAVKYIQASPNEPHKVQIIFDFDAVLAGTSPITGLPAISLVHHQLEVVGELVEVVREFGGSADE